MCPDSKELHIACRFLARMRRIAQLPEIACDYHYSWRVDPQMGLPTPEHIVRRSFKIAA